MTTDDIIRAQLTLACIRIKQSGYMEQFPCDNPNEAYRVLVVWDGDKFLRFIRADVPTELRQTLKVMPMRRLFEQRERIQALLQEHQPSTDVFVGRTYLGNNMTQLPPDDRVVEIDNGFGILANGSVIASCTSVRENGQAAEAYVVTAADYRRKGYAKRGTIAWLAKLAQQKKLAFYTHKRDNIASQYLAESLGLTWVYDIVGYV